MSSLSSHFSILSFIMRFFHFSRHLHSYTLFERHSVVERVPPSLHIGKNIRNTKYHGLALLPLHTLPLPSSLRPSPHRQLVSGIQHPTRASISTATHHTWRHYLSTPLPSLSTTLLSSSLLSSYVAQQSPTTPSIPPILHTPSYVASHTKLNRIS